MAETVIAGAQLYPLAGLTVGVECDLGNTLVFY